MREVYPRSGVQYWAVPSSRRRSAAIAFARSALRTFVPVTLGLSLLAPGAGLAQATRPVADALCQSEVRAQLQRWGVVAPPRLQPGSADGGIVRHWPTSTLGIWVVELGHAGGDSLVRMAPDRITRIAWSASCVAAETTRDRSRVPEPRFDDDDVQQLVGANDRGVIYLWSPHMPLSIDGFRSLRVAADARGLAVHAVLDPAADRAFSALSLAAAGLPATALRVADSVELLFRDVLLHAPSIQVYGGGHLRGSAFPGYHSAEEYGAFLDRVLATPARR